MTTKKSAKTAKAPASKKAKAVKPAAKPAATKDGLRKPQIRILAALKKAGKELTRKEISEKAPVDNAMCSSYIGSHNRPKQPSLITLKYVKASAGDGKAVTTYAITAAGIKALESAKGE